MRNMGNDVVWIRSSGEQNGEENSEEKGRACAKALRWKCTVHVSTRERTGVAGAEAERKMWMMSSERQLS